MKTETELIRNYINVLNDLKELGYSVSPTINAFYIHNKAGTIVGDTFTVDGLRGFVQGIQWSNDQIAGALV